MTPLMISALGLLMVATAFLSGLFGMAGGLVHAIATVTFGVDHVVSGVAINILAPGLTLYLSRLVFTDAPGVGQRQSPPVPDVGRITLPFLSDWLGQIEDKGWFFVSDVASILRGFCTNLSLLSVLGSSETDGRSSSAARLLAS